MFGPLFFIAYRIISGWAALIGANRGRALKARWALKFASATDGGLDDDFVEALFQLVREEPSLLGRLQTEINGHGIFAMRKRMIIANLGEILASDRTSIFA